MPEYFTARTFEDAASRWTKTAGRVRYTAAAAIVGEFGMEIDPKGAQFYGEERFYAPGPGECIRFGGRLGLSLVLTGGELELLRARGSDAHVYIRDRGDRLEIRADVQIPTGFAATRWHELEDGPSSWEVEIGIPRRGRTDGYLEIYVGGALRDRVEGLPINARVEWLRVGNVNSSTLRLAEPLRLDEFRASSVRGVSLFAEVEPPPPAPVRVVGLAGTMVASSALEVTARREISLEGQLRVAVVDMLAGAPSPPVWGPWRELAQVDEAALEDGAVRPGRGYQYRVSAIDQNGNESASSEPTEAVEIEGEA
jgi:hypothetical protein